MKSIIVFSTLLFSCFSLFTKVNAQNFNGKAAYKIRLAEDKFDFDAVLLFNEKASKFTYKESTEKKWVVDSDDPIGPIQVVNTDAEGYILWRDLKVSKFYAREFCGFNQPEIYEDVVSIDWELTNESETIAGLTCQKATTTFRGREYIVWYSNSIPVSTGPWKFYGLPGLIVSIVDSKNEVNISLTDLDLSAPEQDLSNTLLDISISRSDFIDCLNDEYEAYYRRNQAIIAQLQAQAQAEGDDIEISDGGLSKNRRTTELN